MGHQTAIARLDDPATGRPGQLHWSTPPAPEVTFRVLGPLDLRLGDAPRHLPARRKARVVLAVLLLSQPGRPVSTATLAGALWGEEPPASATANLQSYISDLRRVLRGVDPQRPARLTCCRGGYRLRIGPHELDAARFERLVDHGRAALRAGDHVTAERRLQEALGQWRGEVLENLPVPVALTAECERLGELRTGALEDSVEARLAGGQHVEVAQDLLVLVTRYPLRERLWAQLMLARYRSGRRAAALAAYRQVRALLVGELGVEPGPGLVRLHRQILDADPVLEHPFPPGGAASSAMDCPGVGGRP